MVKSASKPTFKNGVATNHLKSPAADNSGIAGVIAEVHSHSPRKGEAGPAATSPNTATTARTSKKDIVLRLLRQEQGATLEQLCDATRWERHSVRGFMSGTVRAKLKLELTSETTERGRVYKIIDESPGEVARPENAVDPSLSVAADHAA